MAESAPNHESEPRKRRSTRIIQAVPLMVTGVDALGRPFQERTSTLLINCHGCRYQSKHYVLKNMWVTLEVPHNEAGLPPRVARGRVTWIQRPRTVRELFQIAVELEIPGNIWGIAFPPPDWFPAPDSGLPSIPPLDAEPASETPAPDWTAPGEPQQSDNVVVIGGAAGAPQSGDVSLHLARQVARLVVEAKQQIQAAVREATAKTVSVETQQLLAAVQAQLQDGANKALGAAAEAQIKQWMERASEQIDLKAQASADALRHQWGIEVDSRIEEARTLMAARVSSVEQAEQETFKIALGASVDAAIARLRESAEAAAERAEQAREQFERSRQELRDTVEEATRRWGQVLSGRTTDAASQMEKLQETADHLSGQIQGAIEQSAQTWRARMEADLSEVQKHAATQAAGAAEHAVDEALVRIAKHSEQEMERVQTHADEQMAALHRQAGYLHSQATQALGDFRKQWNEEAALRQASFAEIQQAAGRVTEFAQQIDQLQQNTAARLEQRMNELLGAATQEFTSRTETAVSGIAERLQPVLDEAGAQTVARVGQQLEQELLPMVDRARDVIEKLSISQASADEALQVQRNQLWQASEQHVQQAAARLQETSERVEKEWRESVHAAMAKWLEELDARATDINHTTIESLYKSANWYEKKVQTQMQSALDKGLEQAGESLRNRAGEMSSLFATELDHYSRSFVEHTQGQLAETAKDAVAQTQKSISEAVETGSAEVSSKARRAAQMELERFTAALGNSFDQSAAHIEAHAVQVRARMGTETRQFVADFQKTLNQRTQESVESARRELDGQMAAARAAARDERASQEQAFHGSLAEASNAAMETYKGRMENASNAWLLTSAAKLNQQADEQIELLTQSAETKLRETFAQVFASVGDSLRERLLGFSTSLPSSPKPPAGSGPEQK